MTAARRCRSAALVTLLALLLSVFQPAALGVRPAVAAELLLVVNQVLTDSFPEVAVYFTFTDAAGLPITDVGKDRVQVVHNGKPVPELTLDLAESEQEGIALVVAIDVSGSMQGQPLEYARAAVRGFLEKMGPNDRGAIVSFGSGAQVVQGLTGDREALGRGLDGLQAQGDTTLYDGVFEAVSLVAKEPLGRRAVVVISDGEDTHSALKLDDVIAKARETSTPVSAIAIGQFQLEPLRRLTLTTGGSLGEAPSPERLTERTAQMSELLRKQYVLRYRAPDTRPPENEVEIAVSQAGQQVRAAQRFPAPPMPLAVRLLALRPGGTVSGPVTLEPALENAERVDSVEYLLDGTPLGSVTEAPYRFTWNSATAPPGPHTLTVRARLGEQVAEQQVPLVVAAVPATSPTSGAIAQASPTAGASPGAAAGTSAAATATPAPTRTLAATATPTESRLLDVGSLLDPERSLPYLLIGIAVVLVLVGGIIFALVRRSSRPAHASATQGATPNTTPLPRGPLGPGLAGGPLRPGEPPGHATASYEPVTREARTIDHATIDSTDGSMLTVDVPSVERPTAEHLAVGRPAGRGADISEAQTAMFDLSPGGQGGPPVPSAAAGGPPPTARLTVRVIGQPDQTAHLGPDQIIGRAEAPGVIVVADSRVSRRHARLSWEDGHFVYRDFAPTNPTRRNGRTIPNPCVLQDGDRLAVGQSEIVLHL
jgi:VWFA-related protein